MFSDEHMSVSVSATTTSVFETQADQTLEFAVNGKETAADLEAVEEAGYVVTFNTSRAVLDGTVDTNTTGDVDAAVTGADFDYEVVVTLDGDVVATSELQSVTIVSGTTITSIDEYTLMYDGTTPINSGIVTTGDTSPTLDATEGTQADGTAEVALAGETYASSDNTIALIDSSTGEITPVNPGTVTFTITKDDAELDVAVTISDDTREVTAVTADKASVDMTTATTNVSVELTTTDQFGDAFEETLEAIAAVENADEDLITDAIVAPATTIDGDGNATATILVVPQGTNTGAGTLEVKKDADTVLLTIDVTVGDDTIASRVFETDAEDNEIDAKNGATDNTITLNYNQYNAAGQYIAPEIDIHGTVNASDTEAYHVVTESDTEDVVSVAITPADGEVVLTAVAEGEETIKVMEGSLVRAQYTVTVVDTTPVLTSVTFDSTAEITEAGAYALDNVVDALADENGVELFLQADGNVNTESDGSGLTVGSTTFTTLDWDSVTLDTGNIQFGADTAEADPAAADSGTIIVKVLDADGDTVGTYELTVDVP